MSRRAVRPIDLARVLKRYFNCWVALSSDEKRVIASGKHPREVVTQAQNKGEQNPILMWVPKGHSAYIVCNFLIRDF